MTCCWRGPSQAGQTKQWEPEPAEALLAGIWRGWALSCLADSAVNLRAACDHRSPLAFTALLNAVVTSTFAKLEKSCQREYGQDKP